MDEKLFKAKKWRDGGWIAGSLWITGSLVWSDDAVEGYTAIIIPVRNSNMFVRSEEGNLGFENWYKVDPKTICQHIGLSDKDKKKIFEEDIVKATSMQTSKYGIFEVKFSKEDACYGFTSFPDGGKIYSLSELIDELGDELVFEVIDNIFDYHKDEVTT